MKVKVMLIAIDGLMLPAADRLPKAWQAVGSEGIVNEAVGKLQTFI